MSTISIIIFCYSFLVIESKCKTMGRAYLYEFQRILSVRTLHAVVGMSTIIYFVTVSLFHFHDIPV